MKKLSVILFIIGLSISAFAQDKTSKPKATKSEGLAKKAFEAHGGKKFKEMQNLSVKGSVDVTTSAINQALPASFTTVFSGDKYRLEISSQFANFLQIYDGKETFTSPQRGFSLPPINRLGFPLLQKLGVEGFTVSDLPKSKKNGFRITSPEGFYTDFYLDKKSNRIKGYDSSYLIGNREATTTVEIDKFTEKDGIIIPTKYAQRFDFGQMTVYADFKAKEVTVNEDIEESVFSVE